MIPKLEIANQFKELLTKIHQGDEEALRLLEEANEIISDILDKRLSEDK